MLRTEIGCFAADVSLARSSEYTARPSRPYSRRLATLSGILAALAATSVYAQCPDPLPECPITADPFCPDSTGNTACVTDAGPGARYDWAVNGGTITDGQGTNCITYTAGSSGNILFAVHVVPEEGCPCKGTLVLEPGPDLDCTITSMAPCSDSTDNTACVPEAGFGATYAWVISGGTITAGQGTRCVTYTAGASGSIHLEVAVALENECSCAGELDLTIRDCAPPPPSTGCRVTGGGNNEVNGNRYTFGGQAGAPLTGCCPSAQPWGEWTHTQHAGPLGTFTFHAGTASAPEGTLITCIECSDPPVCPHAAANGDFKQIDFRGIGTIKNIRTSPPGCTLTKGPLYAFEVHMEDLGEPGSPNDPGPELCPPGGSSGAAADCSCPDFYRIKIHCDDTFASAVAYEVFGYIDGGNFQIHNPTGSHKESQCAQLASAAAPTSVDAFANAPTSAGSNSNSWCGFGAATMMPFALVGWTLARRRKSGV